LSGGSYSTYAYANGNPISLSDPSGLDTTVACRSVDDPRARLFGAKHCFVIVWHQKDCKGPKIVDRQYSLAGNPTPFPQNSTAPTYVADANEWNSGSGLRYNVLPPAGVSIQQFDNAVTTAGDAYDSHDGYSANGLTGPNSNTATNTIIRNAGGVLPPIPGAFGQFYNETVPMPPLVP